jgi:hypothetical protein
MFWVIRLLVSPLAYTRLPWGWMKRGGPLGRALADWPGLKEAWVEPIVGSLGPSVKPPSLKAGVRCE